MGDVVYGVYSTRYSSQDEASCMEPDTVKHSYINIAAPKVANFIKKFRTCEEEGCSMM